jgi:hypothetical protein
MISSNFPEMERGTKDREVVKSGRNLKAEEEYGLGKLCFSGLMGLVAAIAAVCTTMLSFSVGWRYFWLAVCIGGFLLAVLGVVLFFQRPKLQSPTEYR